MSADFQLAEEAQSDLDEIWDYIAQHNEVAADELIERIKAACRLLAHQPGSGQRCEELAKNLRCFPVGNYAIYYNPLEDEEFSVVIVRILHSARDAERLF